MMAEQTIRARAPGSTLVSIVVPAYNEEAVLETTHRRLVELIQAQTEYGFEILYVDDGSKDATPEILSTLHRRDPRVRVLRFARNFGHQMAITAGIEHARGDAVVLIDADLQDPPEVIADMLRSWREGADVAYGLRTERKGESSFKLWTARLFYRLLNRLVDRPIPLDAGDFRLMDRRVVEALRAMPERDRFVRGMVSWVGFRQAAVPYRRHARAAGVTKYPFFRMLRFAVDGVTSFSVRPLRLATWMGFASSLVAMAGVVYAVVVRLETSRWVPGWAALFVAIMFLGGVQLIALGLIGEYVGRIYGEAKRRPLYVIESRLGFDSEHPGGPGT